MKKTKYLKLNIPLSQEDFKKLTNKLKKLGLKYFFKLEHINGAIKKEFLETKKIMPNPYIYRYDILKNEVECYPDPPQKYNKSKGVSENYGKEFNLEEFLKL